MHRLMSSWIYFIGTFLCVKQVVSQGQGVVDQADDGLSGTIKFGAGDLNDEMWNSPFVPDQLQCDSCVAVSYQIWLKFEEFNKKHQFMHYNIPESELLDLTENICSTVATWEHYGMKTIKKESRLSGPGLDTEEAPGVTASGGKWPQRLSDMCESFMGDLGEVTIYSIYKRDPSSRQPLENFLCKGSGIRGKCTSRHKQFKEL